MTALGIFFGGLGNDPTARILKHLSGADLHDATLGLGNDPTARILKRQQRWPLLCAGSAGLGNDPTARILKRARIVVACARILV